MPATTAADLMTRPAVFVTPRDSLLVAAGLMAEHRLRHLPVMRAGGVIGMISDRDLRTTIGDPQRLIAAPEAVRAFTVEDAMTGPAVTIEQNASIAEIAAILTDDRIGALPVVARDGTLLGVVSYVDLLRAIAEAA